MPLNRRSFLLAAGGLAVAATTTTVGCGTNTGRNSANGSLSAWFHEYGEDGVQAALKKYASGFTKRPVEIKWNPGEYSKLLNAALLTDQAPDVFESEMGPTLDMIKAGQVADLTDVIGSAKSDFMPALIERFTYKGKIYAIPQVVDMQVLYYRKSVLEKAGISSIATFDELIAAANQLKTSTMGGFFAGNDGGLGVLAAMLIYASGHTQLNADKTDIGFATQAFYDALVKFREFSTSEGMLKSASAEWFKTTALETGETAMQWGGLWSMPDVQKALKDDFGVMAFPAIGTTGKAVVPFGAFGSCVAAKGKNVEDAKAFAAGLWIEQEDHQIDFANSYGTHVPAKTKLVPKASKLATTQGARAAELLTKNGVAASDMMWTSAMGQAYATALSNIIIKNADPTTEIAAVSVAVKAELKRING